MKTIHKILILLFLQLLCLQQNSTAQDTIPVTKPVKQRFQAEPLKATMMAVAFPGLGQIYNRKYWKIPLVYAGFGGLVYTVSFNSAEYAKFMKAYQDFIDLIPETKSYQAIILDSPETYDPVLHPETYNPANFSNYKDQMIRKVDYYKRYRDLSYIGIAVWYLVSVLDANVDASLYSYDITDNLDIAVLPVPMFLPGGNTGAGVNVSLKVTF